MTTSPLRKSVALVCMALIWLTQLTVPAWAQSTPTAADQANPYIRNIAVQGAERVEPATVASYMTLQIGDRYTPAAADQSIKALFATGLFADAKLQMQGDVLVVYVVENPIINQVKFEGNKHVGTDKLREEVTAAPRSVFTRARVQSDVQRIIEVYRRSGYFAATVTPKVKELEQKRVDLIFEIDEGPTTGIRRINFIGNNAFSDRELRDEIITRQSRWYRPLSSNDNYDPDRIDYDQELLRQHYSNHGYADFRVVSATAALSPDQEDFYLTFTLDEGEKYTFGDVKVETTLDSLKDEDLSLLLPIQKGDLYQAKKIEASIDALNYFAGTAGYAFVEVLPDYDKNRETQEVNLTFKLNEGPRVYVDRIDIEGNTRTLDHVIRREMKIAEGDAFNRVLLDRSRQKIRALGFFQEVEIEETPSGNEADRTTVKVNVKERSTGELSFGLGYSSVDNLLFDVSLTERNLRGRGQFLRLGFSTSSLRQNAELRFTEPRFLGRNLAAGFDLFATQTNYEDTAGFDIRSAGAGVRAGFPTSEHSFLHTRYSLRTDEVVANDAACTAGLISATVCNQRGSRLTSVVGYTFSWDKRDDAIKPSSGFVWSFSQDFAGLGGDVQYVKTQSSGTVYKRIITDVVASASYDAGYVVGWGGDNVRINDRFFKGGSSFRGFETAGIGPRELTFQDALGGKAYAIGTLEVRFPLGLPEEYGITGAVFTDFGTVGMLDDVDKTNPSVVDDMSLRASAGVSVFWESPFGPIRFDFSQILAKEDYDKTETFRFSSITRF